MMGIGTSAIGNIVRSAAIGIASGYLSQTGVATVLTATPSRQLPDQLRSPWVKRAALASAGGEMIANAHFTFLPSRKTPGPLAGRIAFGAGSAALMAMSRDTRPLLPAMVGGFYAFIAANVASDSRAALARHVPDPLIGWAENALAFGLSRFATRK
jgi:hypothetical protein